MNRNIVILSIAAIALGIALYVFYSDNSPLTEDTVALSEDERKGIKLLKAAQEACLSGESRSSGLDSPSGRGEGLRWRCG